MFFIAVFALGRTKRLLKRTTIINFFLQKLCNKIRERDNFILSANSFSGLFFVEHFYHHRRISTVNSEFVFFCYEVFLSFLRGFLFCRRSCRKIKFIQVSSRAWNTPFFFSYNFVATAVFVVFSFATVKFICFNCESE